MSLRSADVMDFLRRKQHLIESGQLVESDHDAVFSDGRRERIFIYKRPNAETKHVIDAGTSLYEAKLLPGFVRLEITTEGRAEREAEAAQAAAAAKDAEKPKSHQELVANTNASARQAMSDRYANRRQQQGLVSNHPLTEANRQFANEVASQKGRRN